jgi:DNA polymerase-3 subunit alpha
MLDVAPWPLVIQLDHEKEVTGIYLSGHPLDNYKFEIQHYGVTSIRDFLQFRETIREQSNPGRPFRLVGLVADAQHRIAKSGNKYGNFIIEDYTGKMEFPLFSDDYLKISPLLQTGSTVLINGFLKQRYNRDEFEFKVMGVTLAETMIASLTRLLQIDVRPQDITQEMIQFLEKYFKKNPGRTTFKFALTDDRNTLNTSLISTSQGIEMSAELIQFLNNNPSLQVSVQTI